MEFHTIKLGFVNVYVLKGDKTFLVDTGVKGQSQKIINELKKLNIKPEEIDYILLTHSHEDHIGSALELKQRTSAKIIMDAVEYQTYIQEIPAEIVPLNFFTKIMLSKIVVKLLSRNTNTTTTLCPDILLKDTFDLRPFGIEGKVLRVPGHTKGSLVVLIDNKNVILGDHLMAFGRRRPTKPMLAYNTQQIKTNIQALIDSGYDTFYLSHGAFYNKEVILKVLNTF